MNHELRLKNLKNSDKTDIESDVFEDLFSQIKNNKKKIKVDINLKINKTNSPIKNDFKDIVNNCKECNSNNLVEKYGYYVCTDCGLENEIIIDCKQEWRYYGPDDNKITDPSRCGMPTNELLPQSSIGSVIGYGNNESYMMRRMRNMQYWNTIPYRESSLLESFNNITVLSQNAGISSCIIEEAKYMYKKVTDLKTSRRVKKESMKAASVYLACKIKGVSRSCKEIASIFNIDNIKVINKSIKVFEEIWNSIENNISDEERFINSNNASDNVKTYDSIDYLHRYCSKFKINDIVFDICKRVLLFIEENKILETHNPISRISTCFYYVSEKLKIDLDKETIINVCKISDVTINKCYTKLIRYDTELKSIIIS